MEWEFVGSEVGMARLESIVAMVHELGAEVKELKRRLPSVAADAEPEGKRARVDDLEFVKTAKAAVDLEKALDLLKSAMDLVGNLREENRQLKLEAFWAEFNLRKLDEALRRRKDRPRCLCTDCKRLNRLEGGYREQDVTTEGECKYIVWVRKLVMDNGMLFSEFRCSDKTIHPPSAGYVYVSNDDTHFAVSSNTRLGVTYGARLWRAREDGDPELEKLVEMLKGGCMSEREYTDFVYTLASGWNKQ